MKIFRRQPNGQTRVRSNSSTIRWGTERIWTMCSRRLVSRSRLKKRQETRCLKIKRCRIYWLHWLLSRSASWEEREPASRACPWPCFDSSRTRTRKATLWSTMWGRVTWAYTSWDSVWPSYRKSLSYFRARCASISTRSTLIPTKSCGRLSRKSISRTMSRV